MIPASTLRLLSQSRWLMPILAAMDGGGARFAALAAQLGISRSALSAALTELQQQHWIVRNSGHGHPLRPEYLVSDAGAPIAAWCAQVMVQRRSLGLEPGDLTRWSLPLIGRLDRDWTRFSTLRDGLQPVTPRALSLTLKQMVAVDLVQRRLEDGFPPHPLYGLTPRGRDLAGAMAA